MDLKQGQSWFSRPAKRQKIRAGLLVALFLSIFIASSSYGEEQAGITSLTQESVLQHPIRELQFNEQSMFSLIYSVIHDAGIPICFDQLPPYGGRTESFYLLLETNTLHSFLTSLAGQDGQYVWSEEDGLVNILQASKTNSTDYPLNTILTTFKVESLPLAEVLCRLPENIGACSKARMYSDTNNPIRELVKLYSTPVSVDMQNVSVREILNELCRRIGDCIWIGGGQQGRREIVFWPMPSRYVGGDRQVERQSSNSPMNVEHEQGKPLN
ncbi:MAG: hypothetical protein KKC51_00785 [Verrucomicrobia bacterium]|nr:hypothetical protein [Verrucomicrobiota bacterium]